MRRNIKNLIMLGLMFVAAATAPVLRPTEYLSDLRAKVDLDDLIPKQFGEWRQLEQSRGQIVNPQQSRLLQQLYTQTVARSYINAHGTVIMMSIAYGANQSDSVALHYPEVCYPAQGFQVQSIVRANVSTDFGNIPAKQLSTRLGSRSEPVTYWSTLGDQVVVGGFRTKLAQLDYRFSGYIPDGLIFRVSSIDKDTKKAFVDQASFIKELIGSLPPPTRLRLAGLAQ
jgi:EpsI family protein